MTTPNGHDVDIWLLNFFRDFGWKLTGKIFVYHCIQSVIYEVIVIVTILIMESFRLILMGLIDDDNWYFAVSEYTFLVLIFFKFKENLRVLVLNMDKILKRM